MRLINLLRPEFGCPRISLLLLSPSQSRSARFKGATEINIALEIEILCERLLRCVIHKTKYQISPRKVVPVYNHTHPQDCGRARISPWECQPLANTQV